MRTQYTNFQPSENSLNGLEIKIYEPSSSLAKRGGRENKEEMLCQAGSGMKEADETGLAGTAAAAATAAEQCGECGMLHSWQGCCCYIHFMLVVFLRRDSI